MCVCSRRKRNRGDVVRDIVKPSEREMYKTELRDMTAKLKIACVCVCVCVCIQIYIYMQMLNFCVNY